MIFRNERRLSFKLEKMIKLETYIQISENQVADLEDEIINFSNDFFALKQIQEQELASLETKMKTLLVELKKKKIILEKLQREANKAKAVTNENENILNELKKRMKELKDEITLKKIKMNRLNSEKVTNADHLKKIQLSVKLKFSFFF